MATYRFRCTDESGTVIAIHFMPFDRSDDAHRYADELRASGQFATVEFAEAARDELAQNF